MRYAIQIKGFGDSLCVGIFEVDSSDRTPKFLAYADGAGGLAEIEFSISTDEPVDFNFAEEENQKERRPCGFRNSKD